MLSKKSLAFLGLFINVGYKCGFIPYKYNGMTRNLEYDPSLLAKIRFCLNVLQLLVYEVFLVYQYIGIVTLEETPFHVRIQGLYLCILYICVNFNHYMTWKHYGSYQGFFNEFVSRLPVLAKKVEALQEVPASSSSYDRRTTHGLFFASFTCVIIAILRALKVFRKPASWEMFSSIAADPYKIPTGLKLCISLVHLNLTSFHTYMITLHGIIIVVYILSSLSIMKNMRIKPRSAYAGGFNNLALVCHTIPKSHHQLCVLQANFNAIYQIWPFGFEFCCGMVVIVRLFLAVILDSAKDFVTAMSMLCCIIIAFNSYADINDLSVEARNSWKQIGYPVWFRKFHRASFHISVSVGGFFTADKKLVLTIVSIIVINAINLVLGYRN